MSSSFHSVITTIQQPTKSVEGLLSFLSKTDSRLFVVGDRKGPSTYNVEGVEFLSLASQLESRFDLARELPVGHYARKNVGYLTAISRGAGCIYETDDDNAPTAAWKIREEETSALTVRDQGWVNVFRLFTEARIWPRGFPLDEIARSMEKKPSIGDQPSIVRAPIQQGLVDNSPDVDAIWRLVSDSPLSFERGESVFLPEGAWCPFNSQSTWWFPVAFPLMYLPSYCSFRMTDIWRSFVAQRCLWELGLGLVFHSSEVLQQRNPHDLMRDFEDEVVGYKRNKELVRVLESLHLDSGEESVLRNLMTCYAALVSAGFFPGDELELVNAWVDDFRGAMCK